MTKVHRVDLVILIFLALILNYIFAGNMFSGSIVAVDLIFVYMGYLITAATIEHALISPKINFGRLLGNLFKYFVLPIICISLLIIPAALIFDRSLINELRAQIIAAFGFSNNYFELTNATRINFLNTHDAFFHTWIIAILAQFYVGYFIIAALIKRFSRKVNKPLQQMRFMTYLVSLLGVLIGLVIQIVGVFNQISYAQLYFSSSTYLLPLAIGGLLGTLYGWQQVPQHFSRMAHAATKRQPVFLIVGGSIGLFLLSQFFTIAHYWQFLVLNLLGCLLSVMVLRGIKTLQAQQNVLSNERLVFAAHLFYLLIWPAYLVLDRYFNSLISLGIGTVCGLLFISSYPAIYRNCEKVLTSIKQQTRVQLSLAMVAVILLTATFTLMSATQSVNGATPQTVSLTAPKHDAANSSATTTANQSSHATSTSVQKTTSKSSTSNASKDSKSTKVKKAVAKEKIATQLQNAWQEILNSTNSQVEIAVYNRKTRQTYHLANVAETTPCRTASIVKVSVLTELLKQNSRGTNTLTESDKLYAKKMITLSDNDSTTYLLKKRLGGYTAIQDVYDDLGMTNSTANASAWGDTTTTALDQVKLLNALYYNSGNYLDQTARTYAQQLMAGVDASQDWGVSAGATSYQLKNGWLNQTDGTWIVNSIGHISATQGARVDYTVAILTNENSSETAGITLVEQLAQATNSILGA
ncbi:serine hydrolase [Lapidilactobacillus bayanensis]|uniref:serine hydrolase n=1 Tax=Lapidilactobacillus bayanensis TaxID=2485998 RepID=UPI000F77FE0C|nr:serine hydrolase [Lapidilactobacillus bayanensis]